MVLNIIVGAMAASYVIPRVTEFAWSNAFTWMGRTAATWAVVALLWDFIMNNGGGQDFSKWDLAGSAAVTFVIRSVM